MILHILWESSHIPSNNKNIERSNYPVTFLKQVAFPILGNFREMSVFIIGLYIFVSFI